MSISFTERKMRYNSIGYRKWGTHARVFSQTLAPELLFTLIDIYTVHIILLINFGKYTDVINSDDHCKIRFNSWMISKKMLFKKLSIYPFQTLTIGIWLSYILRCLVVCLVTVTTSNIQYGLYGVYEVCHDDLSILFLLFDFGCKLNSLRLVDLFARKVYTGGWLHHTPQIYIVVICNWIIELSLQVINDSDYTHTASSTDNENVDVVNGARLLTEDYKNFAFATWLPGSDCRLLFEVCGVRWYVVRYRVNEN